MWMTAQFVDWAVIWSTVKNMWPAVDRHSSINRALNIEVARSNPTKSPDAHSCCCDVLYEEIYWHTLVTGTGGNYLMRNFIICNVFFLWRCGPTRAMVPSFLRTLGHTQRRITVDRTPLDEWSARRRDLYLTTHNTHNRHYLTTHNAHNRHLPDNTQPSQQTSTWQHTTLTTDLYLTTHNAHNRPLPDNTQHSQQTSTWQHTTLTTDKHPCPRWDSNPQSQQASGRRPTP